MKQRITVEDLQQLTDEQKEKLQEWWEPKVWDICSIFKKTESLYGQNL
jgi:ATP-dependent helicase/DNAse subunit B